MPIYEYQCRDCAHRLTARQRISEPALVTCPQCEAEALQRLISQTSFVLKGTGWYASDYKTPSSNAGPADAPPSPSSPEGSSSAEGTASSTTGSGDD